MTSAILITGAAGHLGGVLAHGLPREGRHFTLTDRRLPEGDEASAEFALCNLLELDEAIEVTRGADVIIHSAGIPDEAPFELLSQANMTVTANVFEAARINRVRRVVYASSAHVVGMYKRGVPLTVSSPLAPDSLYAATKLFGESVGSVYAAKHDLEVVSIRIGSFQPKPADARQLQSWLSYQDAVSIFDRAIEADVKGHVIIYGGSANRGRWWSDEEYDRFGFSPIDDAADFEGTVPPEKYPSNWQGGAFALPGYTGSGPLSEPFRPAAGSEPYGK